jgi:hypothetical protein
MNGAENQFLYDSWVDIGLASQGLLTLQMQSSNVPHARPQQNHKTATTYSFVSCCVKVWGECRMDSAHKHVDADASPAMSLDG